MPQSPRECFNRIMHYDKPERMFNWNWIFAHFVGTQFWLQTIDRWHREGLPEELNNPEKVNDYFGVDRYLQLKIKYGVWPIDKRKIIKSTDKFEIIRNEEGFLIKEFKGVSAELSMPEYMERPVKTREDWEKFKSSRLDPDAPGRDTFTLVKDGITLIESSPGAGNFEEARQMLIHSDCPIELFVGSLFGMPRNWLGLTDIALALYDDESWIADMMSHLADLYISVLSKLLDSLNVAIDFAVWWEDMAYNQGPLISPDHVKRLMKPHYRRVNDELFKREIGTIMLDSDGNCEQLIPHWLASGINCIFPNEVAAGNDVVALRKKFGKDLHLIGGIDKRALSRDKKSIDDELNKRLPLVADGGYLPCVDHSVPPDIPFENYKYYIQEQEKYCNIYLNK